MKKSQILSVISALFFMGAANAADVQLFYSPSCPHCHHARDFIENKLVYEYVSINAEAINAAKKENQEAFEAVLEKCKFDSRGVPVIVIGEKCWQGYGESMDEELRKAVESDLHIGAKEKAEDFRGEMEKDAEAFKAKWPERANVMTERGGADQKKNQPSKIYFYAGLALILLGIALIVTKRKDKKKK